jgi:hypothetical protein
VTVAATWTAVPEAITLTFAAELEGDLRRLMASQAAVLVEPAAGSDGDGDAALALALALGELAAGVDAEPEAEGDEPAPESLGDGEPDDPPHAASAIASTATRISL